MDRTLKLPLSSNGKKDLSENRFGRRIGIERPHSRNERKDYWWSTSSDFFIIAHFEYYVYFSVYKNVFGIADYTMTDSLL